MSSLVRPLYEAVHADRVKWTPAQCTSQLLAVNILGNPNNMRTMIPYRHFNKDQQYRLRIQKPTPIRDIAPFPQGLTADHMAQVT